jgi:multidrug resistance efflux pump
MPTTDTSHHQDTLTVKHIFGKPPGWLIHWGISLIGILMIVGFGVAHFVRYPDKLTMEAIIFTENPPIDILSKLSTEIDSVYVSDKSKVAKDQVLIKLRSTVNTKDLGHLNTFFDQMSVIDHIPSYLDLSVPKGLQLGALSPGYTSFVQEFEGFQHFLRQSAVFVKIKSLSNEIEQIKKLNASLQKQENLYERDLALTEKDLERFNTLRSQGVVADVDKEKAESKALNERRNLESFRTQQLNNDVRIEQIRTTINDLTSDRQSGVSTKIFTLQQMRDKILAEITELQNQHMIKAPFDGEVSFAQYLVPNTYVKAGDVVVTCIPSMVGQGLIAQGSLPLRAAGTLAVGQKALLDIENFPSQQYGAVHGEVKDFSSVPKENNYLVTLSLPSPMITTYKKQIPPLQKMKAAVSITTKEFSLLERLGQSISDVLKN